MARQGTARASKLAGAIRQAAAAIGDGNCNQLKKTSYKETQRNVSNILSRFFHFMNYFFIFKQDWLKFSF